VNDINLVIKGDPQALKRHRLFRRRGKSMMYDPSKDDKKKFLLKALPSKPVEPLAVPLEVNMVFVFARPKVHYRTGKFSNVLKDSAPYWHTKTPDTDNLIKFVCDALNAVFWKDDSYVCVIKASKIFGDEAKTILRITDIDNVLLGELVW